MRNLLILFFLLNVARMAYAGGRGSFPEQGYIEYEVVGGVPVVTLSVSGKEYRFIFDTGATVSCITDRAASELGLTYRSPRTATDVHGNRSGQLSVRLKGIRIGQIRLRKMDALVYRADNMVFRCIGVDGILSSSFLGRYCVFMDGAGQRIYYQSVVPTIAHQQWQPMAHRGGCLPYIPVTICGPVDTVVLPLLFDTGYNGSEVVLPDSLFADRYIDDIERTEGIFSFGINGMGQTSAIARGETNIWFTEGSPPEKVQVRSSVSGSIGYDMVRYGAVILDFPGRRWVYIMHGNTVRDTYALPLITGMVDGCMTVMSVWDDQIKKLLAAGDRIISVGDRPLTGMDPCSAPQLVRLLDSLPSVGGSELMIEKPDGNMHSVPVNIILAAIRAYE